MAKKPEFLYAFEVCGLDDTARHCVERIGFYSTEEEARQRGAKLNRPFTIRKFKVLKLSCGTMYILHVEHEFKFDDGV